MQEEALRALSLKITSKTPPLSNILFTNIHAATYLGGAILNRVADSESLATMGEIGWTRLPIELVPYWLG